MIVLLSSKIIINFYTNPVKPQSAIECSRFTRFLEDDSFTLVTAEGTEI